MVKRVDLCLPLGLLGLAGCDAPTRTVEAPTGVSGLRAELAVQPTLEGGEFSLRLAKAEGRLVQPLWVDWGPAKKANFYLTPEGWLVVMGGGGTDWMFDVAGAPRRLSRAERPAVDEGWNYLGAVIVDGDRTGFYDPAQLSECVPLYGAGESPYRKAFQGASEC